jgi:hypothetical protein
VGYLAKRSEERGQAGHRADRVRRVRLDCPRASEHAWQAILATVADARPKPFLGVLAAGPVEGLLGCHRPAFIERVEREARLNPLFAWMLGGVWQCQITDEIWARVQKVRDRRGWDGIPK